MVAIAGMRAYVEEVPLHHLKAADYLAAADKAIAKLHWHIVGGDTDTIVCQVPGDEYAPGHLVSVTFSATVATIRCKPIVQDYWPETLSGELLTAFIRMVTLVLEEQEKAHRNLHPMHREKYGALLPSKSYLVTPVLVYINTLVFIAMVLSGVSILSPTVKTLYDWGGNFLPAVAHGEWWRLFSYMFLHGGAFHWLMNMFALLYIGMYLEPLMGRFRFASAYILTGVCAALLSITIHTNSVGVGASGAIFGMYGVFLSMLTTSHIQRTLRKTMLRSILFFVVLNLLYGLQGNTDNAAHVGGLISGIIIGYVYYPGISKKVALSKQVITTGVIAVGVLLVAVVMLAYLKAAI